MENAPYETVNVWMRQPNLNPRQLIPALLRYDHSTMGKEMTQVNCLGGNDRHVLEVWLMRLDRTKQYVISLTLCHRWATQILLSIICCSLCMPQNLPETRPLC